MLNLKLLPILTLSIMFVSNIAMAEGEKLKEKLSKGTVTLTAEIKGCDVDAELFCPGLKPGSQQALMCMIAYEEKLSDVCKLGIAEAAISIRMGAVALDYSVKTCEKDADKYCLDVQPGDGKIINCLKKNENKISKACISSLKETGLWNIGAAK